MEANGNTLLNMKKTANTISQVELGGQGESEIKQMQESTQKRLNTLKKLSKHTGINLGEVCNA